MQTYPERFKKAAVKKVLEPGINQKNLALKLGIAASTIRRWKKIYKDELLEEVEQKFFSKIEPEEEEEIDIDKLLAEYERIDMSKNELNLEDAIDKIVEKGKLPVDYSQQERYVMVSKARNLKLEEQGMFFRRTGIHSGHIKLWEEELLSMAKKEVDKSEYIKKLEEENKKLHKQLKESEREKKELKILIGLKKKYQSLFKEDEEN